MPDTLFDVSSKQTTHKKKNQNFFFLTAWCDALNCLVKIHFENLCGKSGSKGRGWGLKRVPLDKRTLRRRPPQQEVALGSNICATGKQGDNQNSHS